MNFAFLYLGRGISLSSSESDDPSTGKSLQIQELKEKDDIVIKPADKGSAVVVMDKVDYIEEANRQLTGETVLDSINFFFLNLGRGISLSSSESDDPFTGKSLSLAKKYSLIRRDLANVSRSADSCSSLILLQS
jgi:hypothetical protein